MAQFLCPQCLLFDDFQLGCLECGCVLHPQGHAARRGCPHIDQCGGREEIGSYPPEKENRILGTLLPADILTLRRAARMIRKGTKRQCPQDMRFLFWEAQDHLVYILSLGDPEGSEAPFPAEHAARAVQAIWLDTARIDPLELGAAVDRYVRRSHLPEGHRAELTVAVRQQELAPASSHLLEARFGAVRYGITPAAFIQLQQAAPLRPTPGAA
jgi:hypothetical protein